MHEVLEEARSQLGLSDLELQVNLGSRREQRVLLTTDKSPAALAIVVVFALFLKGFTVI